MADENPGLAEYLTQLREINQKLDRLVLLEERQATHGDSIRRAYLRIEKIEDRVRTLEIRDGKVEIKTGHSSAFQSSVSGAAVTVLIALVVWVMKGGS